MTQYLEVNLPEGTDERTIFVMTTEEQFSREQVLLKKIRDDFCGGVSARLAEAIGKDATYVNRLFYPIGKKGRKGIGLEVMRACSAKFNLPPGFWEGADTAASPPPPPGKRFDALKPEDMAMLENWWAMHDHDRQDLGPEIAKRAARARADLAKHLEHLGISPRPAPSTPPVTKPRVKA